VINIFDRHNRIVSDYASYISFNLTQPSSATSIILQGPRGLHPAIRLAARANSNTPLPAIDDPGSRPSWRHRPFQLHQALHRREIKSNLIRIA
jgi:hypothetical protein